MTRAPRWMRTRTGKVRLTDRSGPEGGTSAPRSSTADLSTSGLAFRVLSRATCPHDRRRREPAPAIGPSESDNGRSAIPVSPDTARSGSSGRVWSRAARRRPVPRGRTSTQVRDGIGTAIGHRFGGHLPSDHPHTRYPRTPSTSGSEPIGLASMGTHPSGRAPRLAIGRSTLPAPCRSLPRRHVENPGAGVTGRAQPRTGGVPIASPSPRLAKGIGADPRIRETSATAW